jgi:hypothetical protein
VHTVLTLAVQAWLLDALPSIGHTMLAIQVLSHRPASSMHLTLLRRLELCLCCLDTLVTVLGEVSNFMFKALQTQISAYSTVAGREEFS